MESPKEVNPDATNAIENTLLSNDVHDAGVLSLQEMVNGLRTVLDQTGAFIYMKDIQGRYLYANQNVQALFNASLEEIIGQDDTHFFDLEKANQLRIYDRRVIDFGDKVESEEQNIVKSTGETRIYWSVKKPLYNDHGQVIGLCGISTDITGRRRAEQFQHYKNHILELLTSGATLDSLLESIVHGVERLNPEMLCSILLLDDEGKRLLTGAAPSLPDFYNSAIHGIEIGLGVGSCGTAAYTGERVVVSDISTHPYWAPYKDLAARAGLGACWSQPIRSPAGQIQGTFAIYHRQANTPSDHDLFVIEQIARLASIAIERKQTEDKVHQLAFYDSLTKLANRILLKDRLNQALIASKRTGSCGAMMFLDLDNFKPLNDAYGHDVGDLMLIEVANRLRGCVREMDTVARFGGDEFVVMMRDLNSDQNVSRDQAMIVAQKILKALTQPYYLSVKQKNKPDKLVTHHASASIGVALFEGDDTQGQDILKKADMAMYQAKDTGKNNIKLCL